MNWDEIKELDEYKSNQLVIDNLLKKVNHSYDAKFQLAQLLNVDSQIKIYNAIAYSDDVPNLIKGEAFFNLANIYNGTDSHNYFDKSYELGYVNRAKYNGSIHLIFGPMFSGKTTELLRQMTRKKIANQDNILIKYSGDNRFDNVNIVTHDKITFQSTIVSIGHCLKDTVKELLEQQVVNTNIFIDEIQFFSDGAEVCDLLANNGYNVFACGLQGDYNRNIFPTIAKLIPLCEKITHLTSIDKKSGKECTNTKRICDSNELELIGGDDLYQAVDRYNYFMD